MYIKYVYFLELKWNLICSNFIHHHDVIIIVYESFSVFFKFTNKIRIYQKIRISIFTLCEFSLRFKKKLCNH